MGDRRTKEDYVQKISTSIFFTNFPDEFFSRDLCRVCKEYRKVIDVYIPNRRSKSGNRFGFVRFIKADDIDCLVKNLCMIWVGRFRLQANVVRFQRTSLNNTRNQFENKVEKKIFSRETSRDIDNCGYSNSYAYVVKLGSKQNGVEDENKPALVLDDSCTLQTDLSLSLVGKLKESGSLSKLKSQATKDNFMAHVNVGSWFLKLQQASKLFNIDGKVYWVRAKEVTGWVPKFTEEEDNNEFEDETIDENMYEKNGEPQKDAHLEVKSEEEEIPETNFDIVKDNSNEKEVNGNGGEKYDGDLKYLPGFTPRDVSEINSNKMDNSIGEESECIRKCYENLLDKNKVAKTITNEDETKMKHLKLFNIKMCWGNYAFDFVSSPLVGNSGGILNVWDPSMSRKEHSTMSDDLLLLQVNGFLMIRVLSSSRFILLKSYPKKDVMAIFEFYVIDSWSGKAVVMGDFNEVRTQEERYGFVFNAQGDVAFSSFISLGGLVEILSGVYDFTRSHKSASKMSKLDHFLIFRGLMGSCPYISSITLDRYLSNHWPILLREISFDNL
ncbi:RNA-directed DNA polymerase, eukaryota [Tanacetum coccineum]